MIRRLSGNSFWLLSADGGGRLLGFIANIYLARILGSDSFGLWIIAQAVLSYAMWIADAGLATVGMREMARNRDSRQFAYRDILKWKLIFAAVVFCLGQIILSFLRLPALEELVIRYALLFLFAESLLLEWYFKGIRHYRFLTLYRWSAGIFYVLLLSLLVHNSGDIKIVPLIHAGAFGTAAIFLHLFVSGADRRQQLKLDFARLVRTGFAVGAGGILAQIVNVLPPILLGYVAGTQTAGIYGAAARLIALALAVDRLFIALFLPAATGWWEQNKTKFETNIQQISHYLVPAGLLLTLLMAIWARPLTLLVFGKEYAESAIVLAILSPFVFLTVLNSLLTLSLIASGHEKAYFRAMFLGSIVSLPAIISGTYYGGLSGAAIAVVVAETAMIVFALVALRSLIRLSLGVTIMKSLVAGSICFGISFQSGQPDWWRLPIDAAFSLLLFLMLIGGPRKLYNLFYSDDAQP